MTSLVVGTAGHIDHGKSALVKALTGTDPDRLKEERERGITIDLGFAHMVVGDTAIALVDVPGHERFVRNMLAGAGGIDAVLLVVAADESVKPQTREHFEICRLLGIDRGVIALTKSDLVDADTIELVTLEVRALVGRSFLADAQIVPLSARTGAGLDAVRTALARLAGPDPRRSRPHAVRLPIDRVFTVKGFGTVITGTLVSGRVAAEDELAALPDGRAVRVRGVQVHGRQASEAVAPRRVALNLGAVAVADLGRGVTLATPGTLSITRRVDAEIEVLPGARPLRHGARVRVHQGTSEIVGRVAVCAWRSGADGDWRRAGAGEANVAVPPGGRAFVRLRLEAPGVVTRLDRLVLRAYSPPTTIGGGVVLDPEPPQKGIRRPATFERFCRLDPAATPGRDAEVALVWMAEAEGRGITEGDLVRRAGLDSAAAPRVLAAAVATGRAWSSAGRVFDAGVVDRIESRVLGELKGFHAAHPAEPGLSREALRERAARDGSEALFDAVVARLAARSVVHGSERLGLTSHRPEVSAEQARIRQAVAERIRDAGLTPPDLAALAVSTKAPPAVVDQAVRALVREATLVRLDTIVFHAEPLAALKAAVRELRAGAPTGTRVAVDVAMFKARYGLTRKYAIPLLEWLDRERVTRRMGDDRIVL